MKVAFVSGNREMLPDPVIPLGLLCVAASIPERHTKKLFDLCYCMFDELEPGPKAYFNGCYVWPIAVARLLVKLLHEWRASRGCSSAIYSRVSRSR